MRQKVTKYPSKDLIVITWSGRVETKPSTRDILKELIFNLTEDYIYSKRLGKKDYLIQLNALRKYYGNIC